MRDYLITFKNGETKKITAQSFSGGGSSSNIHFFNEKWEPLAYYTEVKKVELAGIQCCNQEAAQLAPGTVINTAGAPAVSPVSTVSEAGEPTPINVGSPS